MSSPMGRILTYNFLRLSIASRAVFLYINKNRRVTPTVFNFNDPIKHCVFQKVFKFYADFRIIV